MKITYLITGALLSMLIVAGCKDPDSLVRTDSESVTGLTVSGCLVSDETHTYSAVVDDANKTITVQVPYYISDTEEIQGDLTQMKVSASLPVGAKFEPSIAGIHDMIEGFQSTLVKEDGTRITYTIKAAYLKSDASSITKVQLTDYSQATIRVVEPETEGGTGKIVIYKTSSSIDAALKSATVTISPWATVESSAMDASTGIIDLSGSPQITVTAQNGTDKTVYQTSVEYPDLVPSGRVGYIASLFGFQPYTDDTHGFEANANRTMAVVGDYLIVGNSADYTKMIVLNRYSGEVLDNVKVNTTGLVEGRSIHAITSDDAGHLVAITYTSTLDAGATDPTVRAWVWNNGIENAPKSIIWASINGSAFQNAPVGVNNATKLDIGRTIAVKGDLTTGDAVIATASRHALRPVFIFFKDGVMQSPAYVEWAGGTASMSNSTKVIPLTATKPLSYIWTTGNYNQGIMYVPAGTGSRAVTFTRPSSHWWSGRVISQGYIEFNGTNLLAVFNKSNSSGVGYGRLYVSNIGASPAADSFKNGFIFDSREGNLNGTGEITGSGYGVRGMTSPYSYTSGKTVVGTNGNQVGDVVFGHSDDGNAVQVYMLDTDCGLIAFEITRYDI